MGSAIVVAPLLYLDPTYCQISSTLHISLSELEQVALNFTSPPSGGRLPSAALRPSHRRRRIAGSSAKPSPASHRLLFGRHRRRLIAGSSTAIAGVSSPALRPPSPASHRRLFGRQCRRLIAGSSAAIAGARLGFDYWFQGPGFSYCGTTVMVVPGRLVDIAAGIRNPCRHLSINELARV